MPERPTKKTASSSEPHAIDVAEAPPAHPLLDLPPPRGKASLTWEGRHTEITEGDLRLHLVTLGGTEEQGARALLDYIRMVGNLVSPIPQLVLEQSHDTDSHLGRRIVPDEVTQLWKEEWGQRTTIGVRGDKLERELTLDWRTRFSTSFIDALSSIVDTDVADLRESVSHIIAADIVDIIVWHQFAARGPSTTDVRIPWICPFAYLRPMTDSNVVDFVTGELVGDKPVPLKRLRELLKRSAEDSGAIAPNGHRFRSIVLEHFDVSDDDNVTRRPSSNPKVPRVDSGSAAA